jgi:hypothetical protein
VKKRRSCINHVRPMTSLKFGIHGTDSKLQVLTGTDSKTCENNPISNFYLYLRALISKI